MMTAKSQQFLNELALFYRNKGQHNITSDSLIVRLNGKPVNLFELYSSVIEMGGSFRVNQYNRWDELYLKLFKPQPLGANVSVALRQIYQKYLIAYEKVNFSNFISDNLDNDEDDGANKDFSSNYSFQSNNQLATNHQHSFSNVNPLNKLYCSMMSDLPNEMDFGLRVATILTNSEKIDSLADFKFIDVIIECCILYICSCERSDYSKSTDYRFEEDELINLLIREELKNQPAKDKVDESVVFDQQNENLCDRLTNNKSVSTKFSVNNVRKFIPFKDCNCFLKFWCQMMGNNQRLIRSIFDLDDERLDQLYEVNYCQEEHQKNYYKIKRIVCLLKNVSYSIEKLRQEQQTYELEEFERLFGGVSDNASINFLRFLILLLNSDDQFLINVALEIMSNVSPLVNSSTMPSDQSTYVRLLTSIYEWFVEKVLNSMDVNCLNRCLEIIAKLINSNHIAINRLIIAEVLNQISFFKRLTELLTCQHDVGVVVSTLECCLALSENYPKHLLNENKYLIKMLINLVNCEEGQFFSFSSIRKVKIIDERRIEYHPAIQQHPHQQTILIQQQPINSQQKVVQLNDVNNSAILADNEQHVKNWFYSSFDPRPVTTSNKSILKLNEMYSDYVKHSCVNGRRNVVISQTFANLLKKYFPNVVINQNEVEGLHMKTNVNRMNNTINIVQAGTNLHVSTNTITVTQNNLTSPILKAHLSTPPKSNSSTQVGNPSITNSSNPQQSVNGPNTTTSTASPLIKNLLANKLRNNQTTANSTVNPDESKPANLLQQPNITFITNQTTIDPSKHQQSCIMQPTSTGNIIFSTTAQTTTTLINGASGSNLMSMQQHLVPVSSSTNSMFINTNQHIVPVSSSCNSMFINTNQFTNAPGTMVVQPNNSTGGQQQFLLVRTILPSQNNANIACHTTSSANQQPMRLILPASAVLAPQSSSQASQTISINGTLPNSSQTIITESNSLPNLPNNIDKSQSNEINKPSDDKDKLLKACLGSNTTSMSNSTSSPEQQPVLNSVNSSPLLNVLLDKGKLPEFSTVSNDTTISETNKQTVAQSPTTNQITNTTTNQATLTNHIQSHPLSTLTLTSTTDTIVPSTTLSSANQIISSSMNTNQSKMYIITTTKSPLIKNGNTTSNSTPVQSFIIQQSNTTTTPSGQQYIMNSNLTSQPLVQQQQIGNVHTTAAIQNTSVTNSSCPSKPVKLPNNLPNNKTNEQVISTPVKSEPNNELVLTNAVDKLDEMPNCVLKIENGEIGQVTEENELKKSGLQFKKSIIEEAPVLTNGSLEKEELMQTDEEKSKNSLLKRQLEIDAPFSKRTKTELPIATVAHVQTTIKQEPVIKTTVKQTEIAASSNGILPTISNTLIKTALNSPLPQTNLSTASTCTIDKITIAKPNVVMQSNNPNQQPVHQIATANNMAKSSIKVITKPVQASMQALANRIQYVCEWSNCKKSFEKPQSVFLHVHKDHINLLPDTATMRCSWGTKDGTGPGCKSLRPKYSLLTHLQDFHCGVNQLQQAAKRNFQLRTKGVTDVPQIIPPAHPGYAQNAAFMAIKRHSSTNLVESRPVSNISPLSKSVRLTAAMILRNLAQHSNSIRRLLKNYESYLSELCIFENREDSRTLAQCLAVITQERN